MKEQVRGFLDKVFNPVHSFLDLAQEKLQGVNMVTAQGLDLSKYLAVFGDMPTIWQVTIGSLLTSTVFLVSLLMFRSIMRMYYSVKEGVKWW